MKLYKKKPLTVEAMLWDGTNDTYTQLLSRGFKGAIHGSTLAINTLEGLMTASLGDYVIKGLVGEFYPCKPEIFLASYDLIR